VNPYSENVLLEKLPHPLYKESNLIETNKVQNETTDYIEKATSLIRAYPFKRGAEPYYKEKTSRVIG